MFVLKNKSMHRIGEEDIRRKLWMEMPNGMMY